MARETILKNRAMEATLWLPDARDGHYRGTRFDWSGVVAQVTFAGHVFFGPWNPQPDPTSHDGTAIGTAGEFTVPLGYDEARPGEPFVKIGVGILERASEEPYAFFHPYHIVQPGAWEVAIEKAAVRFAQRVDGPRGWGYALHKTVALHGDSPQLTIRYRLENVGRRPIATFHYDHHFFRIDDTPIGPEVEMTFPFDAVARTPPGEGVSLEGRTLRLPAVLSGAIFTQLDGLTGDASDNGATLRHRTSGAAVTFVGDRPVARYLVWGMAKCLCPEPYIAIDLAPGAAFAWSETFTFARP